MALSATQFTLLCVIGIVLLARPAQAFGAGNIGSTSKIEGENWRHGDLEDTLLTLLASKAMGGKKFSKLDVKRVSAPSILSTDTNNDHRYTLAIGFVITVRPLTLALFPMSLPKLFDFCSGFLAS